jgi:hypothetical protein
MYSTSTTSGNNLTEIKQRWHVIMTHMCPNLTKFHGVSFTARGSLLFPNVPYYTALLLNFFQPSEALSFFSTNYWTSPKISGYPIGAELSGQTLCFKFAKVFLTDTKQTGGVLRRVWTRFGSLWHAVTNIGRYPYFPMLKYRPRLTWGPMLGGVVKTCPYSILSGRTDTK